MVLKMSWKSNKHRLDCFIEVAYDLKDVKEIKDVWKVSCSQV